MRLSANIFLARGSERERIAHVAHARRQTASHPESDEGRASCDRLGVFMLKHALTDRGWHGAFLTDLAVETMTNQTTLRVALWTTAKFSTGSDWAPGLPTTRSGAGGLIGDYESAVTERPGCSKEDIRPYLRCWRTAASELLPDRADALPPSTQSMWQVCGERPVRMSEGVS